MKIIKLSFLSFLLVLLFTWSAEAQSHSNTLTWQWTQGTGDAATGYRVMRSSTSGGPYVVLATINSVSTTTYVDSTVVAGDTRYYVVTAFNTGGDSTPSNQVTCVTPFQAPSSPSTLSGVAK